MELLHCKFCDSNLVNLIGVKVKHDEFAERNINIKKQYVTLKEPQAVKHFLRCFNCGKVSEFLVKNEKGCCIIETLKSNKNINNEIISVNKWGSGFN